MVSFGSILVIGLLLQLLLAYLTAEDARSRGHSSMAWFVCVLLIGVVGVLIYILIRRDTRLADAERPEPLNSKVDRAIRKGSPYMAIAFIGLLLFSMVGGVVAEAVHPVPEEKEYCETTTEENWRGEEYEVTTCDNEDVERSVQNMENIREQQDKRASTRFTISLFGLVLSPTALYIANRRYSGVFNRFS